jgi:hypothetical protein
MSLATSMTAYSNSPPGGNGRVRGHCFSVILNWDIWSFLPVRQSVNI